MKTERDRKWRIDQERFLVKKRLTIMMQTSYKNSNDTWDINGIPRGNFLWFYQLGNREYRQVRSNVYQNQWRYRFGKKRFKNIDYVGYARYAKNYTKKTIKKQTDELLSDAGII